MNVALLKKSRYISKPDVEKPLLLTIRGLQEENVAMQEAAPEMEWCLFFEELDKPMVLKPVNTALIAQFLGDETDEWIGKKVVLFYDPSIMFKGQLKGGIRVRQPRQGTAAPARPATGQTLGHPAAAPALRQQVQAPLRQAAPLPSSMAEPPWPAADQDGGGVDPTAPADPEDVPY